MQIAGDISCKIEHNDDDQQGAKNVEDGVLNTVPFHKVIDKHD
jgi:hypothetical protein